MLLRGCKGITNLPVRVGGVMSDTIDRKVRLEVTFWCTDERHIDDLLGMLKEACFNGDNGRYGGYGYSFKVPAQETLLKKLRKVA